MVVETLRRGEQPSSDSLIVPVDPSTRILRAVTISPTPIAPPIDEDDMGDAEDL